MDGYWMINITCVYEDEPTHLVMCKMFEQFPNKFERTTSIHCQGNGKIKKSIAAYNNAAKYGYYFVITDLDNSKYICAPSLRNEWLPFPQHPNLLFRIAVHEIESWLLADRDNFASFFKISRDLIPLSPDDVEDPKQIIFSLARRSRKRNIREGIPPIDNTASLGPGYNVELGDYITHYWDISNARLHSKSLDKTIHALQRLLPENKIGINNA
jgi:hypothetical protein